MEHSITEPTKDKGLPHVIKIDEVKIQDHLGRMVRQRCPIPREGT